MSGMTYHYRIDNSLESYLKGYISKEAWLSFFNGACVAVDFESCYTDSAGNLSQSEGSFTINLKELDEFAGKSVNVFNTDEVLSVFKQMLDADSLDYEPELEVVA